MNNLVFLDTNVLIYAQTGENRLKQERARHWIGRAAACGAACLNRQILNELTWWRLRQEPRRAIRAAFGFQWYDCLLLAAAQRAECGIFLPEDMRDGASIGGVAIVNPFIHHPDQFLPAD